MVYTVEYAKSDRAGCKMCGGKIAKAELRIGKNVMMEFGHFGGGVGLEWYHYNCFWILKKPIIDWNCFTGTTHLRLEDQKILHLKATGMSMPLHMMEEASAKIAVATAAKEKEEAEAAAASAAFTSSSPATILYTFLQKHLDLLKVPELKQACKEHSLKLPAKAKRADIVKLIMDQKIEKVSGLAYHGVKKHCTAQELKEILKNAGLAVSGTKEDLIGRLMESEGASLPDLQLMDSSKATPKKKHKYGLDFDDGDYYFSGHDMYKKDEEDSQLVRMVMNGSLALLEAELAKLPKQDKAKRAAKLNHARRWTEVEEKWGYDKSWEWFGDTAITAAARRGEVKVVAALLSAGADPTLTACPRDDVTEDALEAAQTQVKNTEAAMKEAEKGRGAGYSKMYSVHLRLGQAKSTLELLQIASKYWPKASYGGVSYSAERSKGFARNPNAPTDELKLKQEIEAFDKEVKVDEKILKQLEVKRIAEEHERQEERKRKENMELTRMKMIERSNINKFNPNATSFIPGVAWRPTPQPRHDVVFQFQGSAAQQTASKKTKYSTILVDCAGSHCTKAPAQKCTQKRCLTCCTGPCSRHKK